MFEDFLNHKCDIYHLEETENNVGYGIATGNVMSREEIPSLTDIPCHFHIKNNSLKIVQEEPYSRIAGEDKITLPFGTDIRKNDIVRDCGTNTFFRADIPKEVRDHHIIVTLKREDGVKGAI